MPIENDEPQQKRSFARFCTGFAGAAKVLAYCVLATSIMAIPAAAGAIGGLMVGGIPGAVLGGAAGFVMGVGMIKGLSHNRFGKFGKRLNAAAGLVGLAATATVCIAGATVLGALGGGYGGAAVGGAAIIPGAIVGGIAGLAISTAALSRSPAGSKMRELVNFISGKGSSLAAADTLGMLANPSRRSRN